MSEHKASLRWTRSGPDFARGQFSREHTWTFDGGLTIAASPAPSVVPAPWSNPSAIDPEEAFVASLSSCHMLTFVWLASRAGFTIDAYEDDAVGAMAKNEHGVPWVAEVKLQPRLTWSGARIPSATEIENLHHHAHEQCFIANSVKTRITIVSP